MHGDLVYFFSIFSHFNNENQYAQDKTIGTGRPTSLNLTAYTHIILK